MPGPSPLKELKSSLPQSGRISWIGRRPAKRMPLEPCPSAQLDPEEGLVGDHYSGKSGKRQLTLIQKEHLDAVGKMLHRAAAVSPQEARRNVVVEGINLLALVDSQVEVGEAIIAITGYCHPCSRMEENLGPGGYNAMRGHGGLTARVLKAGRIEVGSPVRLLPSSETEKQ